MRFTIVKNQDRFGGVSFGVCCIFGAWRLAAGIYASGLPNDLALLRFRHGEFDHITGGYHETWHAWVDIFGVAVARRCAP